MTMNAEGGNSIPSGNVVSRMSLSPDSSEPGSTPKTPECTSIDCNFGAGSHGHGVRDGMTPTPPPSVEVPGLFTSLDACRIIGSNPFPIAPLNFGLGNATQSGSSIWSSRSTSVGNSIGQSGDLSHIWTNRQTTPPRPVPQTIRDHVHSASHLRWGSLAPFESLQQDQQQQRPSAHAQSSNLFDASQFGMRKGIVGQLPFSNTPTTTEAQAAHARRFLASYDDLALQNPVPYQHMVQQQQQRLSRSIDDDDEFDIAGSQIVQDLGVDILRISPSNIASYHPLRQPSIGGSHGYRPAPSPPDAVQGIPLMPYVKDPVRQPFPPPPAGLNDLHGTSGIISTGFTPMHAVNEQSRAAFGLAGVAGPRQISTRFSTRYHGMHTEANASAEHLTSDQNCALWLTNLPPDVTPRQLLGAIRKVGRIWCSFINYPDYQSHHTAAAKVVFFSPKATQQFLSDSWTKGLYIGTNRVRVSHNRIKSESKEDELATPKSRVLIITGRAEFVNEAYLSKYFKDRFIFQNDEVTELINAGGRAVLEWKFGSYRCQAQMGKMSLEKDRPYWLEKVEFGEDPCEVGDTYSSYGIAAERIQGRGL